jgi:hypothetical protein
VHECRYIPDDRRGDDVVSRVDIRTLAGPESGFGGSLVEVPYALAYGDQSQPSGAGCSAAQAPHGQRRA